MVLARSTLGFASGSRARISSVGCCPERLCVRATHTRQAGLASRRPANTGTNHEYPKTRSAWQWSDQNLDRRGDRRRVGDCRDVGACATCRPVRRGRPIVRRSGPSQRLRRSIVQKPGRGLDGRLGFVRHAILATAEFSAPRLAWWSARGRFQISPGPAHGRWSARSAVAAAGIHASGANRPDKPLPAQPAALAPGTFERSRHATDWSEPASRVSRGGSEQGHGSHPWRFHAVGRCGEGVGRPAEYERHPTADPGPRGPKPSVQSRVRIQ